MQVVQLPAVTLRIPKDNLRHPRNLLQARREGDLPYNPFLLRREEVREQARERKRAQVEMEMIAHVIRQQQAAGQSRCHDPLCPDCNPQEQQREATRQQVAQQLLDAHLHATYVQRKPIQGN